MLRKLISILLLFCLLVNIVGYHLIFYFRQQAIKMEMKKLILSGPSSEDENDFIIPLNDNAAMEKLNWEGGDEFSFNGDMYDVIDRKEEGSNLVIRALADKRETALVQKYNRVNGNRHSDSATASLVKLVSSQYLPDAEDITIVVYEFSPFQSRIHQGDILSRIRDVLTPPPRGFGKLQWI